jgi:hypothetical protein
MPDLTLLSKEDLAALASRNVEAMSEEGRQIAFGDLNKQPVPEEIEAEDVSNVRRFAYGFDKTKSDVGLLYRTLQVKAGLGKIDGFNYIPAEEAYGEKFVNASDEVKAAVLARMDQQQLAKDYPVLSRSEDSGGWSEGLGSFAGVLFSPTTLIGGSVAKLGYKGLAALGAGFGAEYNALDQLANTAKIDPKQVAMVSGISAIATPATAKGLNLLGQGVKKALVGRSSPSVQSKANEKMLEIQAIMNEEVSKIADDAVPPTFDELLPIIQQRTGLSLDDLKELQVQSDYKVRLPQSKQSAMSTMTDEANALNPFTASNIVVKGLRDFVGVVSTDVSRINPIIGGRLKKHDAAVGVQSSKYLKLAEPFVKLMKSLPSSVMNQVNRHLGSEDFNGAQAILSRYDSSASKIIDDTQQLLKQVKNDLSEAGYQFNEIENYFPLKVRSYKDFLESVGKEYKQPIERSLEARAKKLGLRDVNALPESEAEAVIIKALKQTGGSKLSEKSLASMSRRVFLDDKIIEQYKSPHEALVEHIVDSVARVQKRKFFGEAATQKGIKSIDLPDSVDKLVAQEIAANRMSPKDFAKLKELLEARFGMGERQTGAAANFTKSLIYQMTLANPLSALTQVADLGMSVFANGLLPTLKAVVSRPKIKLEDLLSDQLISAEIGTVGKMAKALDFTFTWSGFKAIDKLGKETLVNAAYNNFQKLARTDKGVQKLRKRFGTLFADEFDMLMSDLRAGNITENVKMLAFSELSNFQPISLSEMPLKYLQANNGRLFYTLKSFTIKQFDVMRREIIHELTDGNPVEGMKKFIAYATILPASGATVQEVKDFISRGDEISIDDIPDQMAINAIKLMGTSQWVVENRLKKGQFGAAIGEAVMPPITLLDGLKEEFQAIYDGKFDPQTSEIIKRLPPYGKFIQDTFLGARDVRRRSDILED